MAVLWLQLYCLQHLDRSTRKWNGVEQWNAIISLKKRWDSGTAYCAPNKINNLVVPNARDTWDTRDAWDIWDSRDTWDTTANLMSFNTMKITVYEKPTCTTCKNLAVLLRDRGIDYDKVNYFIDPFDAAQLKALLTKLEIPAFDLLRKKEPLFKEMALTENSSEDEVIAAIVKNPGLLNRPIVEAGDKAVIARPIERALEFLNRKD